MLIPNCNTKRAQKKVNPLGEPCMEPTGKERKNVELQEKLKNNNLDIVLVKDLIMGADVKEGRVRSFYIAAVVKTELYRYDLCVLGVFHNGHACAAQLAPWKVELEDLRKVKDVEK